MEEDRYDRQRGLVPSERLAGLTITIVGVGAVGRQVALQAAAMGARRLQLVDFDAVSLTNVATQGYALTDIGKPKVEVLKSALEAWDPMIHVEVIEDRFRPSQRLGEAVFSCVDSIAARAALWRAAESRCSFYSDARILGEVIRVLAVDGVEGRRHYATTLFDPQEAERGGCTTRSTIYSASIAAGFILHQFARWLRGQAVEPDLTLSLLSVELVAMESRCLLRDESG